MAQMLTYADKDTWIHRLSGVTKLIFFLSWSVVGMVTYDTRVLAAMLLISIALFATSKTDWHQISMVVTVIGIFLLINVIAIFVMAPLQGTKIYGSETVVCHLFGHYDLTKEQLFYEMNVVLKYFTIIPAALMFIVTTNPSEFAASLNKIGVSYNIGYAVAIALRYIPDVQKDFHEIKNAQQARGVDMSKKAKLPERIRNVAVIIFPLIFSSMDRIDVVSNAMELRGFGKNRKRTWYTERKLGIPDKLAMILTAVFAVAARVITFYDGSRFYNPFC